MNESRNSSDRLAGGVRPLRTALIYAASATAWIVITGWLVGQLVTESTLGKHTEMGKGLFFVLVTSGVLWLILHRQRQELEKSGSAIQERDEQYRAVFEGASDGMAIRDLEGVILEANPAFCQMHGYTREEMCGKAIIPLIHPEHRHLFRGREETQKDSSKRQFRAMHVRKDGTAFAVEVSTCPLLHRNQARVLVVVREITDLVRAEHEMRESQRFLRSSLDALLSMVGILDDRGRILTVNSAWQRFAANEDWLCPAAEPGMNYIEACEATQREGCHDGQLIAEGIRQVITHKQEGFEHEYACEVAGQKQWFVVRVNRFEEHGPTRVIVAHVNITERKRAEEVAKTAAWQQAAVAQLGHLALAGVPLDDFMKQTVRAVADTLGVDSAEILEASTDRRRLIFRAAHGFLESLPAGTTVDADGHSQSGFTLMSGGSIIVENVAKETRFTPSELMLQTKVVSGISTVIPGKPSFFGVLGAHSQSPRSFSQDDANFLTAVANLVAAAIERKRAEEAQTRQAQELTRSNLELERFAYVASHDLQEPLRMVASYTQLLAKRYRGRLDEDADEFIGFVVDGVTQMQALINDLLTYSRVGSQAKPFAPADCEAVLERTLANLQVAVQESSAVVTHDPLPTVTADQLQLVQLFQNLIANAIKFRGTEGPRVHVSARQEADEWVFAVTDNGIGIESQYFERIFVIFQRLHGRTKYPGTGMGLTICKKIVERHGGRIWVESEPGKGSTFYFALPATSRELL